MTDYDTSIRIVYRKYFRDDMLFFDVANLRVDTLSDMVILTFDQKIFFGTALRHKTVYLMKDAIMSITVRKKNIEKEILIK